MAVCALDHIVLNVADVERSLHFYQTTLGLAAERVEAWRRHEVGFPNEPTAVELLADELISQQHGFTGCGNGGWGEYFPRPIGGSMGDQAGRGGQHRHDGYRWR
jgi:catechol 2,3-dioxygenase-like lactoylglutathione lyase family enzyme